MLMAAIHPAQFADSIEQYNWAHSLEWGYWKHPPLPTWMMRGAIAVMGASHWTAPALAAACLAASAWLMWDLGCMLLGERAARLAIVLWPLHGALMWRADVFNHNTVLVLLATAMAWSAVRAWRSGALRDWLLFGVASGLALLTKYQALVTLLGVIVALGASGSLREARTARGVCAAVLLALAMFMPHALWALEHELPTLRYLDHSAPVLTYAERVPAVLRFFAAQLGLLVSILLAAAAARYWPAQASACAPEDQPIAEASAWMFGLVVVPLVAVAATVIVGGHTPQKMWGLHTTLFLPLWLAWTIARARPSGALASHAAVAGALLVAASATYAVFDVQQAKTTPRHTADRVVPASQLAHAVLDDWQQVTDCPLRFVSGTGFAAGLVSVYSGLYPAVLEENFDKSPWIDPTELRARGSVDIHGPMPAADVPDNVHSMEVPAPAKFNGPAAIWWHVVPPARACDAQAAQVPVKP